MIEFHTFSKAECFVFCARVDITSESVGIIGIMNFQYILFEYGANIEELLISSKSFPSPFGGFNSETKYNILFLTKKLAKNLKKLSLIGFNLDSGRDDTMVSAKVLVNLIEARGVEIVYN